MARCAPIIYIWRVAPSHLGGLRAELWLAVRAPLLAVRWVTAAAAVVIVGRVAAAAAIGGALAAPPAAGREQDAVDALARPRKPPERGLEVAHLALALDLRGDNTAVLRRRPTAMAASTTGARPMSASTGRARETAPSTGRARGKPPAAHCGAWETIGCPLR